MPDAFKGGGSFYGSLSEGTGFITPSGLQIHTYNFTSPVCLHSKPTWLRKHWRVKTEMTLGMK
jgi:hypothetical protein